MHKILPLLTSTLGGWVCWWLGNFVGITTALMLSLVGSVVGWYIGIRINHAYLD